MGRNQLGSSGVSDLAQRRTDRVERPGGASRHEGGRKLLVRGHRVPGRRSHGRRM